jgi:hypothetical protein
MYRTQQRYMTILAATSAALALAAAPALAGSSGCSGGDCQDEDAPAPVVPVVPTPVAPAPLQGGDLAPEHSTSTSPSAPTHHAVRGTSTHTVTVAQTTMPRGAVAAGAGGMAPQRSSGLLVDLGGAALVLIAAGGSMVAVGRRAQP